MSRSSTRRSPVRARAREAAAGAMLDAAEAVAVEVGLAGLTIAAVAERAGVAVGTLYNYFPDREGLVAALFQARRAAIAPHLDAAAAATRGQGFEARVRGVVHGVLAAFEAERGFLQLAVQAERAGLPKRDGALMTQLLTILEQIMREGARAGWFPASRVPIHARMLQGSLRAVCLWRLDEGGALTTDAALVVDGFLHGARADR